MPATEQDQLPSSSLTCPRRARGRRRNSPTWRFTLLELSAIDAEAAEGLARAFEKLPGSDRVACVVAHEVEQAVGFLGASVFDGVVQRLQSVKGALEADLSLVEPASGLPESALQALDEGG